MSTTHTLNAAELPIQSVTVLKTNKAEVVRVFALDVKNGENKVVVSNISNSIDTSSIRISGLGGAARLADVVCVVPSSGPFQPHDALYALMQQKKSLEAEKMIREQEANLLVTYGGSLSNEHVSVSQFTDFLNIFREERKKGIEAVREIEDQLRALDEKIALEAEKGPKGLAKAKITVILTAEKNCAVSLRLTYLVSHAQWDPVYDLYASTVDTDAVSLHYRAQITQSTGEDWADVQLTLSTTTMQAHELPRLGTYRITRLPAFADQPRPLFPRPSGTLFGASALHVMPTPQPTGPFGQQTGTLFGNTEARAQQPPTPPVFGQSAFGGGGFGGGGFGQSSLSSTTTSPESQSTSGTPTPAAPSAFGAFSSWGLNQRAVRSGFGAFGGASNTPTTPAPPAANVDASSEFDVVQRSEADSDSQVSITEGTTTVKSTPLSSSFTVQGKATVPSDGATHIVSIAYFECDARLTRVCVPRLETNVFLQCRVENLSEYRLLPGPVNTFLDDEYVSRTSIKGVNVNETFECALGIDSSVQVSYERSQVKNTAVEPARTFGDVTKFITACTARTTLRNKSSAVIKNLIIQDSLPLSSNKDADKDLFKIILRKPKGLADAAADELIDVREHANTSEQDKQKLTGLRRKVRWSKMKDGKGGEQEGKYEWVVDMLSGEELSFSAEWDVRAPMDIAWREFISAAGS